MYTVYSQSMGPSSECGALVDPDGQWICGALSAQSICGALNMLRLLVGVWGPR